MEIVDLIEISKDVRTYEWCDCMDRVTATCGCGKHEFVFIDEVIHWLGQHWEIECAFKYAIAGLSQSFYIFKYMEDGDIV